MKKALAILLPIIAIGYLIYAYGKMHPPLQPEAPVASRLEQAESERIDSSFQYNVDKLPLTADQHKQLSDWMARNTSRMDAAQRRQHNKALKEILPPDQLTAFQELRKEQSERKKQLRETKQERLARLVGEGDMEKFRQDREKIKLQRKERTEAAKAGGDTNAEQK